MSILQLILGVIFGTAVGLAVIFLMTKLRQWSGHRVRSTVFWNIRLFLPGLAFGMFLAIFTIPVAPPVIGSLVSEAADTRNGPGIKLTAKDVHASAQHLLIDEMLENLEVNFYYDKDGTGKLDKETGYLGEGKREPDGTWTTVLDQRELPAGTHTIFAEASLGQRKSSVMNISVSMPQ